MPDWSTGAVSMKITSSTSTTSTRGVMLISASAVWVWPPLLVKATGRLHGVLIGLQRRFFHAVEQLAAEVVHAGGEVAAAGGELVVGDHGGNGDDQAGRGGDQRFRHARSHRTERRGSLHGQAVEGVDDAHDGAEESDEGGDGGDAG